MEKQFNSKKNLIFYGLLIFLFLIFGFIGGQYYVIMHEMTHKQVFSNYGMKSEISLGILDGKTTSYDVDLCGENCELSNNLVEIVGYHIGILILNLWLMFGLYLLIKISFDIKGG